MSTQAAYTQQRPQLFDGYSKWWWRAVGGVVLALATIPPAVASSDGLGAGGGAIIRPPEYQHIRVGSLSFELPSDWQWARSDSRSKFKIFDAGSPEGNALYISKLPLPPRVDFDSESARTGMSALLAGELDGLRRHPRQGWISEAKFNEAYATTVTVDPEPIRKRLAQGFRGNYDIRLKGYEQTGCIAFFKLKTHWALVRCITINSTGSLAFNHLLETIEFEED